MLKTDPDFVLTIIEPNIVIEKSVTVTATAGEISLRGQRYTNEPDNGCD